MILYTVKHNREKWHHGVSRWTSSQDFLVINFFWPKEVPNKYFTIVHFKDLKIHSTSIITKKWWIFWVSCTFTLLANDYMNTPLFEAKAHKEKLQILLPKHLEKTWDHFMCRCKNVIEASQNSLTLQAVKSVVNPSYVWHTLWQWTPNQTTDLLAMS